MPVIGNLGDCLAWPEPADIWRTGSCWAQSTLTILWLQTTGVQSLANVPAYRLWLYFKICLDALRYRYLAVGGKAQQRARYLPPLCAI
jgi:hypothetical protein